MPEELPFIDEHRVEVPVDRDSLWQALIETFGGGGSELFVAYGRLIGVEPLETAGPLDQPGSTRTGFRVESVKEPEHLRLAGRHRFSTYSLTWKLTGEGSDVSSLAATTRAIFPGPHGRVYRALVIDSGAHARITRRMLGSVARRATS